MPERELLVRIVGDDRSLQAAFSRSSRSAAQFETRGQALGRSLTRSFGAAGVVLGGAALFAGVSRSVEAASDLNEEVSKSRQVFGDSSRAIEDWSQTTASAIGIARVEALRATGTFGNLFSTVGLGQDEAAGMSRSLVELAADLASFNNADISDVLAAIRSGLIGEAEPLRRYGVLLSEARVQQAAMEATGKTNVRELTNQEKALARYNIILSDTVPAQGDFARTSEGLANQSRILRAQLADVSAELGGRLLPALLKVTQATNFVISAFEKLGEGAEFTIDTDNIDLTKLRETRAEIVGLTGDTDLLVIALDRAIALINAAGPPSPDNQPGPRGPGAIAASNERVDEQNRLDAQRAAQRRLEASRKRFAEFTKGLGLKLKRAGLTEGLDDDLAVLEEIERAIRRQIAQEGHTFALENDLADIQLQIANTREQQQSAIAAAERDADDRARRRREQRRRSAQERREDAREARDAAQFTLLGLTAEGDRRIPGIGALRRRGRNLIEQLRDSGLDEGQIKRSVQRISVVFTQQFKTASREVRQAILAMFNDIASALDEGTGKVSGPRTKFRVVNTSNVLAGLGLSEAETKALRSRLSRIGVGGTTSETSRTGGAFGTNVGGGGSIIISGPVTVVSNDPDDFGRKLERKARSEGSLRTGPSGRRHKN